MLRAHSLELSLSTAGSGYAIPRPWLPGAHSLATQHSLSPSLVTATDSRPQLPVRKWKAVTASAVQHTQGEPTSGGAKDDPFFAASLRLQSLLAGAGDGEAELVDSFVAEEPPEARLSVQCVLAAAITGVAVTVSMLCGQDPWGGATFSLDSVLAAAIGLTASLPLMLLRWWTWTPHASRTMPAFDDMHTHQLKLQTPWLSGSAKWHAAMYVALEVVPITLLLLPAAQGGLMASVHLYTMALQSLGAPGNASPETLQFSCLALTAAGAALTKGLELNVSDSEYEVVQTAVDNSDRYYRLMAMDMSHRETNAARAALAFQSVAEAWLDARNDAALAAMGLCALDVMAMGALWYGTGDLAAPAAAALALNGIDAWHLHEAVMRKEAQIASMSGRGPPRPSA